MAKRISHRSVGYVTPSCLIGDVKVIADDEVVRVRLTAPDSSAILDEHFYIHNGEVTIFDLGSLVEADMRARGIAYGNYTVELLNDNGTRADSCPMHVLYCDRITVCTEPDIFCEENFLTTHTMRRLAPGDTPSLYFLAKSGEDTDVEVSYRWRGGDGTVAADDYTIIRPAAAHDGVQHITVPLSVLTANTATRQGINAADVEIVSLTVAVGTRSCTYFIDRSLNDENSFTFRNCFNVQERLCLPLTTTTKTETEQSVAVMCHTSQLYDRRTSRTYECETGPLTSDEAEWIDQLFASHEVLRYVANDCDDTEPYILMPVLITESTSEMSDNGEKPDTTKFTWRYADNRPMVRFAASPSIFTTQFNRRFS